MGGLADIAKLIKADRKEQSKGPGQRFIDAIDRYLSDVGKMNDRDVQQFYSGVITRLVSDWGEDSPGIPKGFHYRASQAGMCERSLMYSRLRYDEDPDKVSPLSRRKMDNGTFSHLRFQCYITHMVYLGGYGVDWPGCAGHEPWGARWYQFWEGFEKWVEREVFNPDTNSSGHIDAHILFEGVQYLVDLKTVVHETGRSIGFKDLLAVHDHYVPQFVSYAVNTGIRDVLVLYESKDTQEYKCYHLSVTDDQIEDLLHRQNRVEVAAKAVEMGGVTTAESGMQFQLQHCWRCGHKTRCLKDGKPTVASTFGAHAINADVG